MNPCIIMTIRLPTYDKPLGEVTLSQCISFSENIPPLPRALQLDVYKKEFEHHDGISSPPFPHGSLPKPSPALQKTCQKVCRIPCRVARQLDLRSLGTSSCRKRR